METWTQLFATILTALTAGGFVSLLLYRVNKNKVVAETKGISAATDATLSGEVRQWLTEERQARVRAEMKAERCSARIDQLEAHIDLLERQLRPLGVEVPPMPPPPPWPDITVPG